MSSLLRLERKKKNSSNPFLFLSYSLRIEMIKLIWSHTPAVSPKTIPNSKPKWAKSIPIFRPKRRKNSTVGAAHTYMAYIREYPPPPWGTGHQISLVKSTFELFCAKQILTVCTSCKTLYNVPSHTNVINRGLSQFVFINGSWSLRSCRGRGEMQNREPPDFRSPEVSISAQLLLPHLHSVSLS